MSNGEETRLRWKMEKTPLYGVYKLASDIVAYYYVPTCRHQWNAGFYRIYYYVGISNGMIAVAFH